MRVSFVLTGAAGALVALALTAYVLPRFGREDSGDASAADAAAKVAAGAATAASGGQQESVANKVLHVGEESGAELGAVKALVAAQERLEGADDLPDGQVAVAR